MPQDRATDFHWSVLVGEAVLEPSLHLDAYLTREDKNSYAARRAIRWAGRSPCEEFPNGIFAEEFPNGNGAPRPAYDRGVDAAAACSG